MTGGQGRGELRGWWGTWARKASTSLGDGHRTEEAAPVLVLALFSETVMAGAGAEGAADEQVLFFALTPLVTLTPPAIPANRSSLLLV